MKILCCENNPTLKNEQSNNKKKINLSETIKTIGTITVDIKLYEGVIGKLKVQIIAE